jgi:hypothetical protein
VSGTPGIGKQDAQQTAAASQQPPLCHVADVVIVIRMLLCGVLTVLGISAQARLSSSCTH